ncbi:MAG: DNA adenine methylase [Spirochaetia bacterium]|nr:DNA adenine methylase [Spirochaetia bacterium]
MINTVGLAFKEEYKEENNIKARPFLKWAGGKRQLLSEIINSLPEDFNYYFEPFLGGGAVFFALGAKKNILADSNEDLINVYKVVQNNVENLIHELKKHKNEKEYYYEIRDLKPGDLSYIERASRFIFLNKTCYNGLYRVNSRGIFNVPFGSYKNPQICDNENLRASAVKLQNVEILCAQYDETVRAAKKNDFVYFDPPYEPVSASSNFVQYEKNGFTRKDQIRLHETFSMLTKNGVKCMLSNSSAPFIKKLYKEYNIKKVQAARFINSAAEKRGKIEELLITNY